jgi:hypothetical protein
MTPPQTASARAATAKAHPAPAVTPKKAAAVRPVRSGAAARPVRSGRRPAASRAGARSVSGARRVSGPKHPRTAGGRPRASAKSRRAPRRVSGSSKPAFQLPQLRPVPVLGTLGSHAFRAGRWLPDSPLLDRLVRGRTWVGLLGVLLFGVVALNVSLLKLNAVAGRNAETARTLSIKNARLRSQVSRLASSQRLQREGEKLGLVMPAARKLRYLSAGPADARRAARALRSWSIVSPEGLLIGREMTIDSTPEPPLLAQPTPTSTTTPAGTTGFPDVTAPAGSAPATSQPQPAATSPARAPVGGAGGMGAAGGAGLGAQQAPPPGG